MLGLPLGLGGQDFLVSAGAAEPAAAPEPQSKEVKTDFMSVIRKQKEGNASGQAAWGKEPEAAVAPRNPICNGSFILIPTLIFTMLWSE